MLNRLIRLFHKDIKTIKSKKLTYLEDKAMLDLKKRVQAIEKQGIKGAFIEAGCALGGSAILIALNKADNRAFKIYDVFGMIPPPSEKDGEDVHRRYDTIVSGKSRGIQGGEYYGYKEDLLQSVKNNFQSCGLDYQQQNVNFIQGLYEDTMPLMKEKVALAHIDCDWYDSVMVCLENIVPKLSVGGVLVIDDYYAWSGCTKAVDDFFRDKKDDFSFERKSRLHIKRIA